MGPCLGKSKERKKVGPIEAIFWWGGASGSLGKKCKVELRHRAKGGFTALEKGGPHSPANGLNPTKKATTTISATTKKWKKGIKQHNGG